MPEIVKVEPWKGASHSTLFVGEQLMIKGHP